MPSIYDPNAQKADESAQPQRLTGEKPHLEIGLSGTLEERLDHQMTQARTVQWAQDNKPAVEAYNSFVEENGCFGDEFRVF